MIQKYQNEIKEKQENKQTNKKKTINKEKKKSLNLLRFNDSIPNQAAQGFSTF